MHSVQYQIIILSIYNILSSILNSSYRPGPKENDFKRQGPLWHMVVKDRIGHTRYLVFEVVPGYFDRKDIIRALNRASARKGIEPSPRLILFERGMGIVRCTNKDIDAVKALLPEIKDVGGAVVIVRTVRISGTLLKAKGYLTRGARARGP